MQIRMPIVIFLLIKHLYDRVERPPFCFENKKIASEDARVMHVYLLGLSTNGERPFVFLMLNLLSAWRQLFCYETYGNHLCFIL